jgi:hypothetical protein
MRFESMKLRPRECPDEGGKSSGLGAALRTLMFHLDDVARAVEFPQL